MSDEPLSAPAPETPPVKKRIPTKVIVILFIIIILGIGYVFISQQSGSPDKSKLLSKSILNNPAVIKMAEKLPIPKITLLPISPDPSEVFPDTQNSNTATPVISLPDKWKTYQNTDLNFSFTYPADLKLNENPHGLGVSDISLITPSNTDPENSPDYQILIYPKTVGNLIGQNFDELYALPENSTQRMSMAGHENTSQRFTKFSNRTISGLRTFNFQTTSDPPDPSTETETGAYVEIEDSILIISTGKDNIAILDHIVDTIKHPSS